MLINESDLLYIVHASICHSWINDLAWERERERRRFAEATAGYHALAVSAVEWSSFGAERSGDQRVVEGLIVLNWIQTGQNLRVQMIVMLEYSSNDLMNNSCGNQNATSLHFNAQSFALHPLLYLSKCNVLANGVCWAVHYRTDDTEVNCTILN